MRLLLAAFALAVISASSGGCHDTISDEQILAALGKDCGPGLGCDALTECGTVDLSYHMCVFDCMNDPTTCPKGSFCSKNGLDTGHFCMRECNTDDDCVMATGNDTQKCNNGVTDDGSPGPLVCAGFP